MSEIENEQMNKIVALCKRRGIIFQSSEMYGGINDRDSMTQERIAIDQLAKFLDDKINPEF